MSHLPLFASPSPVSPTQLISPDVDGLLTLIRKHDPDTATHSLRVCRYALCLANACGLERRQRLQLAVAAQLHDIGKLIVPAAVLQKPTRLTSAEVSLMQKHPAIGERMLRGILSPAVLAAIRSHHENFDGSGYPDGVPGQNLPLLARVLAVADSFDAMTSPRPYRAPSSWAEALELLQSAAGTQFDPALVKVFCAAVTPNCADEARYGRGPRHRQLLNFRTR